MKKKFKDKDAFIEEANRIHKGKYNYSKVIYKDLHTKVEIVCPVHGSFWQRADHHIKGCGCSKCSKRSRKNTTKFIAEVEEKFGIDKYDLSQVDYKNTNTKVVIGCKEHGFFEIRPEKLLKGQGCPKCRYIKMANTRKYPASRFFKKAKEKWGTLFDYSNSKYVDMNTKIEIRCTKHNHTFFQTPAKHLDGFGCIHCQTEKYIKSRTQSTEKFIQRARKVHKDRFDYSKTIYTRYNHHVLITFPKHGDFEQLPIDHLHGSGCPKCQMSRGERLILCYLEDHKIPFKFQYKFNNCRNKRPLPFDFAVFNKDNSIRCLIEYQGEQHFEKRGFYKEEEKTFKELQKRDNIKKEFCKRNKIDLKYITYKEDVLKKMEALFGDIGEVNV